MNIAEKSNGKEAEDEELEQQIEKLRKNYAKVNAREIFFFEKMAKLLLKLQYFNIALLVQGLLFLCYWVFICLVGHEMDKKSKKERITQIFKLAATKLPFDNVNGTTGNITTNGTKN